MQVFIDGSEMKPDMNDLKERSRYRYLAWGGIINLGDTSIEFHGGEKLTAQLTGCHEYLALIEAVIKINEMGIDPTTAVYHTDHDQIPYIGDYCHEHNYKRAAKERELARLKKICDIRYNDMVYELVVQCLLKSRFVRIKGHQRHVYHSRCDYLAKYANQVAQNIEMKYMHFEDWIARGFSFYDSTGTPFQWFPPFANSK